ncbi:MAG: hypothetical protein PHX18_04460 [Candidatus Gastranaerophilales bacterium]|nr:hypothetical protein [Candidatus Gastranaerophilales bacterium]
MLKQLESEYSELYKNYAACRMEVLSDMDMSSQGHANTEILDNNSKILRYLNDKDLAAELEMLIESVNMAIQKKKFELLQNLITGLSKDIYKLAAFEIMYFDKHASLLSSDIIHAFKLTNFVQNLINNLKRTALVSPTNTAFALRNVILAEQNNVDFVFNHGNIGSEFLQQVDKRYHDNFGSRLSNDIKKMNRHELKSLKAVKILSGLF